MKRWAIYARYSDEEKQKAKSIDDQLRECRGEIARRGGGDVVAIFADAGVSGFHTAQRPEYLRMVRVLKDGGFDALMAEDTDRLARSLKEMASLYDIAEHVGAEIWTITDGRISLLHAAWKGMSGQEFLRNLAVKVRRGLVGVVERGGIPGGRCYGYDVAGTAKRTVNEEQAEIVRRIYREYASGKSPRHICRDLNKQGIAGPRGGVWRVSTLIGNPKRLNGTLNNPVYIGRLAFNRQTFRKNPETGRRIARANPVDQWLFEDHPELVIVGADLWAAVERRRKSLSPGGRPEAYRRPVSLLSGLVRCAGCGGPMTKSGDYFRCADHLNGGPCGNNKGEPLGELERITIEAFQATLNDPEVIAHMARVFRREVDARVAARAGDEAGTRRRLADIETKIGHLTRAVETGLDSPSVRERLSVLDTQRQALAATLAPSRAARNVTRLVPDMPALFRAANDRLGASLRADTDTGRRMREAFRTSIAEIRSGPAGGKRVLEVDGNIRGLLQVAGSPEIVSNDGCGNRI